MKAKNRRITYLAVAGGITLALLGGVTIAANVQSNNIDLLLGRGKQHTNDNSSLSGEYIDFMDVKALPVVEREYGFRTE